MPKDSDFEPILFILYSNSLTKTCPSLQVTMYTDDNALIFKNKSKDSLEIYSFLNLTTLYQYLNVITTYV